MNKRLFGARGESQAASALMRKGMKILDKNYRRRPGEIDLIAQDGNTIVFVEVKSRSGLKYGAPAEAVDAAKRRHILQTAMVYLTEKELDDVPVRFDIVEVLPESIRHIPNAFTADD